MIRRLIPLATALGLLVLPAVASANALNRVENAYTTHGTIRACQFSVATLSAAAKEEDVYDAQYFEDLTSAIQAALQAAAAGDCRKASHGTGPTKAPVLPALPAGATPASPTASTGSGLPLPIVVLAIAALILVLGAALTGLVRFSGSDPMWRADLHQATGETGHQLGLAWAALLDRLRIGQRRVR